jgi:hypothetical protein
MNDLIAYLTENCCGADQTCGPVCKPAVPAVRRKPKTKTAA